MQTVSQLFDLTDRAAIVTGGAVGIGEMIARRLCEAGAMVLVADQDLEHADLAVQRMRALGGRAQALRVDTSRVEDAQAMVAAAVERFGRLDIVVNNAGIFPVAPVLELTEATWDRVLSVNLKGAFFLCQAAARAMKERGGAIVNVASIDALHPSGGLAHYDASKGGLLMLTRSLALELAPLGIRVNTVSPGGILTPGALEAMSSMGKGAPEGAVRDAFAARVPLKRLGSPDDIALAVLYLVSPAAAYVTGSNLVVDGGILLT